jgi:hypothetical protein
MPGAIAGDVRASIVRVVAEELNADLSLETGSASLQLIFGKDRVPMSAL